jgi:hypothetical protein
MESAAPDFNPAGAPPLCGSSLVETAPLTVTATEDSPKGHRQDEWASATFAANVTRSTSLELQTCSVSQQSQH